MKKEAFLKPGIEIWGGIECSFNRVNDTYMDQLALTGHDLRDNDMERFAKIGIKAMRYPVLWEKHGVQKDGRIHWQHTENNLLKLKAAGITPIAGLVHHGSGPAAVSFYDGSFEEGVAAYAAKVAEKFPWLTFYTPVNEPLTTARFCGLYGHWFPHDRSDHTFLRILLAECKATVMAMAAIRKINPAAILVQTEDLGKTHSTPLLQYQASFENQRRWLSVELLCGMVGEGHPLIHYLLQSGITREQLAYFTDHPCPPGILGFNHYITSERYIDERQHTYPRHTWGGNGRHHYADVEAVRVSTNCLSGPRRLLKEAWDRFHLPMAVTEVHLHCTREEQLRWFAEICTAVNALKAEGVDLRAVTAWAILGSFDWCSLLTRQEGMYESGLFDIRSPEPRQTILTTMVATLAGGNRFSHPVLEEDGWWKRNSRIAYHLSSARKKQGNYRMKASRPILITGKTGTLGKAFARICDSRAIQHIAMDRRDLNIAHPAEIEQVIRTHNPWAIINTAGFVQVDEAESNAENCFLVNSLAPQYMAALCSRYNIRFATFSSDLVFDGKKKDPYLDSDTVGPISVYGQSKAKAEAGGLTNNPDALIIRTSAFFGPWDGYNFVANALHAFQHNLPFRVTDDVIISPTYVPDLVHVTLDLLLDGESGIWNIANKGALSWAMLATDVAQYAGYRPHGLQVVPVHEMGWVAARPNYSVLSSEKGLELPSLENALERFFKEQEIITIR